MVFKNNLNFLLSSNSLNNASAIAQPSSAVRQRSPQKQKTLLSGCQKMLQNDTVSLNLCLQQSLSILFSLNHAEPRTCQPLEYGHIR
jgi:hypothetical protein